MSQWLLGLTAGTLLGSALSLAWVLFQARKISMQKAAELERLRRQATLAAVTVGAIGALAVALNIGAQAWTVQRIGRLTRG